MSKGKVKRGLMAYLGFLYFCRVNNYAGIQDI